MANDQANVPYIFLACAVVALAGALLTYFYIPETLGKSLEELTAEAEGEAGDQELMITSVS